ncbi:Condensin-2 complex subunit G2 [Desmophyllum pertusum]|uniref:Condensin-2 complex subunit G2 n=1 Tax=Desmophyllum pertusum TaxID=174260 RepID=A0A9W9YS01_9CNID|nr:Condensin-2 complex subunit G2 [Desmophyllum pertusum]
MALEFLSWIMGEPTCRTAVQECYEKLRQIADNLRLIMATIESRLTSSESVPTTLSQSDEEFFTRKHSRRTVCQEIHLHHMEKNEDYGGAMAAMENVLVWADRVLLPIISADSDVPGLSSKATESAKRVYEEGQISCLVVHLVETVLTCVSEMVMLGMAEEKFYNHAAVFTTSLAKLGCKAVEFFPQLSKLLYQLAHSILLSDESGNVNLRGGPVSIVLTNVLQILMSCYNMEVDVLPQALLVFRPALAEVLLLTELGRHSIGVNTSLMAPLVSAVLTTIAQQSSTAGDDTDEPELPRLASFIVKMIASSQALLRSFMFEVKERVLSGALDEAIDTQTAVVALLGALQGTAETNVIKTCALHISERLKTSDESSASEQREEFQSARLLVQSLLSKLQIAT